ncbi:dynamin family protein [Desulfobacula sp.]|uniref:dynamin family protein n=1 Tax=Desulfobacula sp. TaxID=2593537 RepID=UPI002636671B|nr:dynamin family protein [Desulfobacula sp.]
MMTNKTLPLDSLEKIVDDTLTLLQRVEEVPQMSDPSFGAYKTICRRIPGQIRTGRLNIAVVGVIKSGKSTFVNALIGKELVKRGAGVITSITTRIRKGKKNQAHLYFKSWDTINSQIQKALLSFPEDGSGTGIIDTFDIRRKKDREYLNKVYQTLITDFPVTNDKIRPETLLMRYALQGFDVCKHLVQADETTLCFESKEFDKHKTYTSDPNNAFYIKDVCLDVFGKAMDPNIEIADCQGADSTDPDQLAKILTYLESANLIVYCISSRTGLRQSDITFLNRIKNLGLLENILFINNCDLTEHEDLDDLLKIETSIYDHLGFLNIHPRVFSFSSLYNLFLKRESKLSQKETGQLRLWQKETEIVAYCDAKTMEFNAFFKQGMDKYRYDLLISNHLKRLGIIIARVDRQANIFLDLLSSDTLKEKKALETLENLHQTAARLESIVANSTDGAVRGLKDEITANIKKAFVQDQASILKDVRNYIQTVSIDIEAYRKDTKESGFNQILYLMFQEFKRKLDVYVIEAVTPKLKKIVLEQEERISAYFQSLFDSYQIDLLKADHYSEFESVSKLTLKNIPLVDAVDIDTIKKILGLQLPTAIFEAKYTPRIRANVFTDFGLHTVSQIVSSFVHKKSGFSFSPGLKRAAVKIKKENQKLLKNQFEHYHTSLRSTYFLPLIEAATRDFKEKINERFSRYHSFKQEIEHLFSLTHAEKKDQKERVLFLKQLIQSIARDIAAHAEISWE